jgi:uncharacterized protein YndB with AHSA1/START domain
MRLLIAALAMALLAGPAIAASRNPDVTDTSTVDGGGARVLQYSVEVNAPAKAAWDAVADQETVRRWLVPFAAFDLRQGGTMEEGFSTAAKPGDANNIRHDILAYVPGRVLVYRNTNTPPGLPGREAYKRVTGIFEVQDLGAGKARIVLSQVGYLPGEEFDKAYAFFKADNANFLQSIKTALESSAGALHSAAVAAAAAPARAPTPVPRYPDVRNASGLDGAGARVLQLSVDIDGPAATAWDAFTDPKTINRWAAPLAVIDLKQGGTMEESYEKGAHAGDPENIRHEIIAYVPGQVLVFRNTNAPAGLPGREHYKKVVSIVRVQDLGGGKTRLSLAQTGYAAGPEFDALYGFFSQGNAQAMQQLKTAMESPTGPLHAGAR